MNQQSAASNELLFEMNDGIGKVTFNRPQARNAFTFAMYERLAQICESAEATARSRSWCFSGAGDKAFASGTDISQFRAFTTPEDALEYESPHRSGVGTLEQCRVPTIAAIDGACTGGGGAHRRMLRSAHRHQDALGFPVARTLGNCLSMGNISRLAALIGRLAPRRSFSPRGWSAPRRPRASVLHEVVEDTPR